MESYEQFYSRTMSALLPPACSTSPRPQRALSDIHFRGRRLLQPVVSEALRVQMAEDRQTAVERDRRRQTRQTDALLERVHDILINIQLKKVQKEPDSAETPTSDSPLTLGSKTSPMRSIRTSARPSTAPAQKQTLSPSSSLKRETLRLLNQRMEKLASDASSDGSVPGSPYSSLCLSLMGSYAQLPSPQPSRSPRANACAGNILISSPVSESELSTTGSKNNEQAFTSTPSSTSSWTGMTRFDETQDESGEKPRPARRSAPAPLNRSYDVENPSPSLNRPHVDSVGPNPSRLDTEGHSQRLLDDQVNLRQLTGGEQQIQALEVLRERLEREHTPQISRERQTQHPQQEIQRKLNEHSGLTSTKHTSHTQEVCVEQMKPLCRLTAAARGFLTRRLLQTDRITHLRKTIQDSRDFICSFQTDSQLKRVSVSHQDLSLYQRVTAQLRSALHDVHQIFTVWPVRDRLRLLQQDREIRRERTLREMDKDSPGNTRSLSSVTLKTLDRKAQRQAKKTKVIPKSSAARSAVKKRDECVEARHRKYLSLG
uniref:Centriolar coiled-coil protein of 110 kDa-like n=1 Tax=Cyprinus carpio TaxID=7962 RepID=A0A8C1TUK6_CYPCA